MWSLELILLLLFPQLLDWKSFSIIGTHLLTFLCAILIGTFFFPSSWTLLTSIPQVLVVEHLLKIAAMPCGVVVPISSFASIIKRISLPCVCSSFMNWISLMNCHHGFGCFIPFLTLPCVVDGMKCLPHVEVWILVTLSSVYHDNYYFCADVLSLQIHVAPPAHSSRIGSSFFLRSSAPFA